MEDLVPGQFLISGKPDYAIKVVDIDSLRRVSDDGKLGCFCWGDGKRFKGTEDGPVQALPEAKKHRCEYKRTPTRNKHCLAWRSPEQIRCEKQCTLKSDVFSLAVVFWAIMPGTGLPFGEWPYGDPATTNVTREKVIQLAGRYM